jgi:hypothetical protein
MHCAALPAKKSRRRKAATPPTLQDRLGVERTIETLLRVPWMSAVAPTREAIAVM